MSRCGLSRIGTASVLLTVFAVVVSIQSAQAIVLGGPNITGQVTPVAGGYRYDYTIDYSNSILPSVITPSAFVGYPVTGLSLPFYNLAPAASDIQMPNPAISPGWTAFFGPANPLNWSYDPLLDPNAGTYDAPDTAFIAPPYVLNWSGGIVLPGQVVSGFSFISPYAPANGPVDVIFGGLPGEMQAADPPLPNSPNSPFAQPGAVPEPLSASLGALGLAALALTTTRRRAA